MDIFLRRSALILSILLISVPGTVFADNLTWGGTYTQAWSGFGISPYTATNNSITPRQGMQIFCLDFNDEIGPPMTWQASILPLTRPNVEGTGAFAGKYAAQYGGDYNTLVAAAFNDPANLRPSAELTPPVVSGAAPGKVVPFAFNGDTSGAAGNYAVTLASQDPYIRYLEAAWLFTDAQAALPKDLNTDLITQVAAWELFVNYAKLPELTNDIKNTSGKFVLKNYLALSPGQTYLTSSSVHTQVTGGLSFEEAVDAALAAAQTAVLTNAWGPGSYHYGSWSLVTGTPAFTVSYGAPVQEFLSPNAIPDQPPIPEPKAVLLLATVAGALLFGFQKRQPVRFAGRK